MGTLGSVQEASQNQQMSHSGTIPHPKQDNQINDKGFIAAVRFLVLIQQAIVCHKLRLSPQDETYLCLGKLRLLRLASLKNRWRQKHCRAPTAEEWEEVEKKIIVLERYLPDDLIRLVSIKHISGLILEKVAIFLLILSIFSLIGALKADSVSIPMFLACFTVWSATTGALGSAAFLYVNALSIQVDPKVDVTSRTLVVMRLILGALFAVIMALPFGQSVHQFKNSFMANSSSQNMPIGDGFLLLLPFILGFSTPLVLSILGRFVQSARTFFGLRPSSDTRSATGTSRRGKYPAGRRLRHGVARRDSPDSSVQSLDAIRGAR